MHLTHQEKLEARLHAATADIAPSPSLFTITKGKEICFSSPDLFPSRMAIFNDFVLLYKKVRVKMSLINLSGILAFSFCTSPLSFLCGAWPQTQRESDLLRL